jgi:hypothetical protein
LEAISCEELEDATKLVLGNFSDSGYFHKFISFQEGVEDAARFILKEIVGIAE